jgi:hypothetical protein
MDNAFLVRVSISVWSARKMDKAASRDAKSNANASAKANVKVYKTVLAADELEAIGKIAGAARLEHQKRTVPYAYDGPGMITADGYPAYKAAMAQHEKDFYAAVARFNAVYDREREAARSYLGDMFNPSDYPPSNSVGSRFSFGVTAEPMPQAAAFHPRGLPQDIVDEIKQDIAVNNAAALDDANQTAWGRVLETTEKLKLRLQEYTAGSITKFYESWLCNVIELAELIPSINVTGDADLARIGQKLAALSAYAPADLKVDVKLRDDCVKQTGLILASIGECYQKAA